MDKINNCVIILVESIKHINKLRKPDKKILLPTALTLFK